jgi:hypothetical protein
MKINSLKQQRLEAELGLIIDEMGLAMRNANREYIARSISVFDMTESMKAAVYKFQLFCKRNYGN